MNRVTRDTATMAAGAVAFLLLAAALLFGPPETANIRLGLMLVPPALWFTVSCASMGILFLAFFLTGRRF